VATTTVTFTIDWTLTIAVYAAIVSTVAILWDIWKWKRAGPNLDIGVSTGMVGINMPEYEGKTLMMVNATNRGDRPTTITHLTLHRYASWWNYVRRRAAFNAIVTTPSTTQPVPFVLAPGAVWTGLPTGTPRSRLSGQAVHCPHAGDLSG
jgi:hypothetical protein